MRGPSGSTLPAEAGSYDAASRDQQFQRAGALIARYSTLLIVIWDGKNTDHRAGTARVVEFRRDGIMPTADDEPLPSNVLLSARDNDLMFEIRCSRLESAGNGAPPPDVEVRGFVGSGVRDSREVPQSLDHDPGARRGVQSRRGDLPRSHRAQRPATLVARRHTRCRSD